MRTKYIAQCLFLAAMAVAAPRISSAGFFISVGFAPPALPVYAQPICPGEGYIWTPGYWAYGPEGYYWVPGTWVLAPQVGYLWTPAWWGWSSGQYLFHEGYWGSHIGFYGGVNYGFGYIGHGYEGGYWDHGAFQYNRTVNNVNVTNIHNVYNKTVINNNVNVTRVSYNGGNGGVTAAPTPQESSVAREQHVGFTQAQQQHQQQASTNRAQFASVNHGTPAVAATPRPAAFNAPGTVHGGVAPVAANAARPNPVAQGFHNAAPPTGAGQRFGANRQSAPPAQFPHNNSAPAAQPHYNAPAAQPHYNAPAAQPHYNAPAAQPHYNAPASQPHYNAPAAHRNPPPARRSNPQQHAAPAARGGGHEQHPR